MNAQETYVQTAIAALRMATTEQDLLDHWTGEQENRALLRLTKDEWPGLDLLAAFNAHRIKLQQDTANENL